MVRDPGPFELVSCSNATKPRAKVSSGGTRQKPTQLPGLDLHGLKTMAGNMALHKDTTPLSRKLENGSTLVTLSIGDST